MRCPHGYKLVLSALFFLSDVAAHNSNFMDIAAQGYEQYQDIIINNVIVKPANYNHKHGAQRYDIINSVLQRFKRPITMLDLGASQGYYSFRAAHDYPASTFVMIEGDNPAYPKVGSQLLSLCKANTDLQNIVLLNKLLAYDDVAMLGECEHFDVVLALNVVHWFGLDWKKMVDAILELGTHIIFETPPQEKQLSPSVNLIRKNIIDYLFSKGAQVIGTVPRHTSGVDTHLYLVTTNKDSIKRKTWLMPPMKEKTHIITSTYESKTLTKHLAKPANTSRVTPWLPGINLVTYKMYQGTYPIADTIKNEIERLSGMKHGDWQLNNIIVQGNTCSMIDVDDAENPGHPYEPSVRNQYMGFIDVSAPDEVKEYFWKVLVPAVHACKIVTAKKSRPTLTRPRSSNKPRTSRKRR